MNLNLPRILGALLLLPAALLADTPVVPELNPASASSALAVITGLALILRDRWGKR